MRDTICLELAKEFNFSTVDYDYDFGYYFEDENGIEIAFYFRTNRFSLGYETAKDIFTFSSPPLKLESKEYFKEIYLRFVDYIKAIKEGK